MYLDDGDYIDIRDTDNHGNVHIDSYVYSYISISLFPGIANY